MSWIENLDPRTKLASFISILIIIGLLQRIFLLVFVLLFLTLVLLFSWMSLIYFYSRVKYFLWLLPITFTVHILFSSSFTLSSGTLIEFNINGQLFYTAGYFTIKVALF
ncbi:MAG: CbiQ family ECF transporter T component, partial [Fidelibacterota bacterium]